MVRQWNSLSEDCVTTRSTISMSVFERSQRVMLSPSSSLSLALVAEKIFTPVKRAALPPDPLTPSPPRAKPSEYVTRLFELSKVPCAKHRYRHEKSELARRTEGDLPRARAAHIALSPPPPRPIAWSGFPPGAWHVNPPRHAHRLPHPQPPLAGLHARPAGHRAPRQRGRARRRRAHGHEHARRSGGDPRRWPRGEPPGAVRRGAGDRPRPLPVLLHGPRDGAGAAADVRHHTLACPRGAPPRPRHA